MTMRSETASCRIRKPTGNASSRGSRRSTEPSTNLNKAWATQRWSRRLNSFEDVDLPLAEGPGPSERYLDLHRYWSDVSVARLQELEAIRRRNMPDVPSISNLWDTASRRGFDYLGTYKSYVSYGAEGFYPGDPISGAFGALMTKGRSGNSDLV